MINNFKKMYLLTSLIFTLFLCVGCTNESSTTDYKTHLMPIFTDIPSPDNKWRLITNDSGLILTIGDYQQVKSIIGKDQILASDISMSWSPDCKKVLITQSGEELSTFSVYDIENDKMTPIIEATGLLTSERLPDSPYDWYIATSVDAWLNNDEILFSVNHMTAIEASKPTLHERGYRRDLYQYSLEKNTFINLTNSQDGEFYGIKEMKSGSNTIIVELYRLGNSQDEMIFEKNMEINF